MYVCSAYKSNCVEICRPNFLHNTFAVREQTEMTNIPGGLRAQMFFALFFSIKTPPPFTLGVPYPYSVVLRIFKMFTKFCICIQNKHTYRHPFLLD